MKTRAAQPGTVRIAAYVRQSIDEESQEFKSVHAQREAIDAFVLSQREKGWKVLPERYEDAGFSGKDTNRPAFKRLLADVEAGRIDVVAVYKLDRFSRSMFDFVRLMDVFEKRGVEFVSITESFTTATSAGRMVLHMLASFAQFERETIGERTASKMIAIRRRGNFAGGCWPLGYDVVGKKLVVNADEAERVRAIFRLYLEKGSLLDTVDELNARGWRTKSWTGKRGQHVESAVWSIESLRQMLDRVTYVGLVRAGKETFPGVHERIIDQKLWDDVQAQKRRLRPSPRQLGKNKYGALLKAVLVCGLCGSTMNFGVSGRVSRRYRYYDCNKSRRFGRTQCAAGPVPAEQLEEFVVEKVRAIGRDPSLVKATADAARAEHAVRRNELEAEVRQQDLERRRVRAERTNLVNAVAAGGAGTNTLMARVGELDEQLGKIDVRVQNIQREIASVEPVDDGSLQAALAEFDGVWNELFPREKAELLALLIERITFASTTGALKITFRTTGLKGLGA